MMGEVEGVGSMEQQSTYIQQWDWEDPHQTMAVLVHLTLGLAYVGLYGKTQKYSEYLSIDMIWNSLPSRGSGILNPPLLTKRLAKREDADIVDTAGSSGFCGRDRMMGGGFRASSSGFVESCVGFSGIDTGAVASIWSIAVISESAVYWSVSSYYELVGTYLFLSVHAVVKPEPMWELLVDWYLGHDDV